MTRDSIIWWIGIVSAVILAVSSRMDLIDPFLPASHTDKVHALIEFLALIIGIASGKMATSPLPISDEGRAKYLSDTVKVK